jgi:hypothetical protein
MDYVHVDAWLMRWKSLFACRYPMVVGQGDGRCLVQQEHGGMKGCASDLDYSDASYLCSDL